MESDKVQPNDLDHYIESQEPDIQIKMFVEWLKYGTLIFALNEADEVVWNPRPPKHESD